MTSRPLAEVLDVRRDSLVAVIGGGGKMTLLTALGVAWARAGGRPLLLSTTQISEHEEKGVPGVRTVALPQARSAWPQVTFLGGELLVVGRRGERPGTLDAIQSDEIPALAEGARADLVLVKADRAHGRSLKSREPGETSVPLDAALVIALAGLDVWGAELGPETVDGSERFAAESGMTPGERLEDDAFYRALADPAGYRAAVPPGARYLPFLNKADRPVRMAVAQRLAAGLLERGIGAVVWGDVRRLEWTLVRRGGRE
jgi:probable selenium-dependent hydroxylase accessory protein YqeC